MVEDKNIAPENPESPKPAEVVEGVVEAQETKEGVGVPMPMEDARKIRQEIENMPVDDDVKMQTQSAADDLAKLEEEAKIKKLLELARSKGVVYAVQTAKNMNDPYVLDMLHDQLVQNGLYREFKI